MLMYNQDVTSVLCLHMVERMQRITVEETPNKTMQGQTFVLDAMVKEGCCNSNYQHQPINMEENQATTTPKIL